MQGMLPDILYSSDAPIAYRVGGEPDYLFFIPFKKMFSEHTPRRSEVGHAHIMFSLVFIFHPQSAGLTVKTQVRLYMFRRRTGLCANAYAPCFKVDVKPT